MLICISRINCGSFFHEGLAGSLMNRLACKGWTRFGGWTRLGSVFL